MVTAKVKKIGNLSINVISEGSALLENKFINENDAEMDYRATEAVRSALDKARICKKPVAKYDAGCLSSVEAFTGISISAPSLFLYCGW